MTEKPKAAAASVTSACAALRLSARMKPIGTSDIHAAGNASVGIAFNANAKVETKRRRASDFAPTSMPGAIGSGPRFARSRASSPSASHCSVVARAVTIIDSAMN